MELKKLLIVYIASFVGPFGGNAIIPLFHVLGTELATDPQLLTLSITVLMIPFTIIQFFSGTISDLFNRQDVCVIGLLVYGLGAFLVTLSPNFEFLLFARVIQGIGYGIIFPVLIALVGDLTTAEKRGKTMGILGAFATAGVAFGPLTAAFLVQFGWKVIFFITSTISIITGIIFWLIYRNFPSTSQKKQNSKNPLSQMKNTITWNILLFSLLGFTIFISYICMNVSIGDRYSMLFPLLTDEEVSYFSGIILSFAGISGIIASPIAGFSINKIGRKKTAFIGHIILTISLPMFFFGKSFIHFIILFFSMGTGAAIIWTAYNTITVELDPMAKGTVSSIYNGIRFFGYSMASPYYILFGFPNMYIASLILALLSIGLLFLLKISQ